MSTTLKQLKLKFLHSIGIERLKAKSILKQKYYIKLGDNFSESSYLNAYENIKEILCCLAWCKKNEKVRIIDIGAHDGFISTHLAQLLSEYDLKIYSFEPVLPTLMNLYHNVTQLSLSKSIEILPIAISDINSWVSISYDKKDSMLAQINILPDFNRLSSQSFTNITMTLDGFLAEYKIIPSLLKIDVEGLETRVLKGAKNSIEAFRPAICIEWNPETASQTKSNLSDVMKLLDGYKYYYINDYEGQKLPFISLVEDLNKIDWVCNLFCIHHESGSYLVWKKNLSELILKYKLNISI